MAKAKQNINLEEKPNFKVPNLERGLQVLEYLIGLESGVSLNVLAKELCFPVNSLSRIMNALKYYGYVDRDAGTKAYSLSHKMFSMGFSSSNAKNLMENSLDVMRALRDEVGETVVISIIDEGEGLVLEQVQGRHAFRFVCDPGTKQAIHCSASCKAILAFTPEDRFLPILDSIKYPKLTDTTITSKKAFLAELEEVRRNGYGLDRAEAIDGVHCVAAPILDRTGCAVAAVTVTGPSNRMTLESMDATGVTVRNHTLEISKRMGYLA